jgi:hypothetical protein
MIIIFLIQMAFITEIIILNGIKIHDPKKPNPIKIRPPLLNSAIHLNTHHLRMPHLHHWLMLAALPSFFAKQHHRPSSTTITSNPNPHP